MNKVNQIKKIKLTSWFLNQLNQPESIPARFYANFLLNFILENLNQFQKEQFLRMVAGKKNPFILPFVFNCIPDFETKFTQSLSNKISNQVTLSKSL